MISIYTHTNNPLKKEFWKYIAKKAIRKYSGPDAVLDSLKRGLTELNIPFQINPYIRKYDTVHVLAGISILENMISKKEQGKIKTLIAGPNLVVMPSDKNNIICSPYIDAILLPSEWTKEFYEKEAPSIAHKTNLWPAGTQIPTLQKAEKTNDCIVFKKDVPIEIFDSIIEELKLKKIKHTVIEYGKYKYPDYLKVLNKSKYIIYLQKVESQGLALQEAWSHNIPTLVWNPGFFTYANGHTLYGKISAPYLNDANGIFFKDIEEFPKKLDLFLKNIDDFTPRKYCIENLSDKVSAEKYIGIIKNLNK
jgi:hypothetical protein